ncbi:MAG TPA: class I SAM-dependent methyltransferase [Phototrophicaceae bacterium]|nr:class I SAM-dependent methyltransferase [Phototrophicaceae bacterium]
MTDHFQQIYAHHADQYEALVAREDYQGNILAALQKIRPLAGLDVVEFGAGTGRLTGLLAPLVKSIRAFDASEHMLDIATDKLQTLNLNNWQTGVADNCYLPVANASADVAIEGWSFGHATGWYPETWKDEVGAALAEMQRVLRPGGTAILLETQTTGSETPQPPNAALADLYAWWEQEHGFSATWIRTDYRFESLEEAERLSRFFFGDDLAATVVQKNWVILPECTGLWWKTF